MEPYRGGASFTVGNVQTGVASFNTKLDVMKAELPAIDIKKVQSLLIIALALSVAVLRVNRALRGGPLTKEQLAAYTEEGWGLRKILVTALKALAAVALIRQEEVDKIMANRGKLDMANDLVESADVLTRNQAAIAGKTAVTQAQIERARFLGTTLITVLKPGGARKDANLPAELVEALDIRDRMWTLLKRGYRDLWRAGAYLFVEEVDAKIPPLLSRTYERSAGDEEAAPPAEPAKK